MKEPPLTPHASRLAIFELADGSLLVQYPGVSDGEANALAVAAAHALEREAPQGFLDAVAGARTLFIEFDPGQISTGGLTPFLSGAAAADQTGSGRALRIPVVYGGEAGADLEDLARGAGLSPQEFARRHAQASYRVAFLGFAPGFAYLTGLPPQLHAPRLATPRTRVAAGTVAIGGPYTGIYPGETPGGWRLIGRTPVRLFDPDADPPSLLLPGDEVRFEPAGGEQLPRSADDSISRSREPSMSANKLFHVLSAGVFSSVQGAPRYGQSRYGVPPGGAMDLESLAFGNASVGNPPGAAGLEMTLVGAELESAAEKVVCLAGASPEAQCNGRPVTVGEPFRVRAGDRLRITRILAGARSYLCVEGGLADPRGAQISPRLGKGDVLRSAEPLPARVPPSSHLRAGHEGFPATPEAVVRVVLGPHRSVFREEGLAAFLSSVYRVSASSDRRGVRLEGAPIALAASPDIPPEGTPLGGIQVARDGMPIVLGPDRPVTGGYARIATAIRADFSLLAQAVPGAAVRFSEVGLAEALRARVG